MTVVRRVVSPIDIMPSISPSLHARLKSCSVSVAPALLDTVGHCITWMAIYLKYNIICKKQIYVNFLSCKQEL